MLRVESKKEKEYWIRGGYEMAVKQNGEWHKGFYKFMNYNVISVLVRPALCTLRLSDLLTN